MFVFTDLLQRPPSRTLRPRHRASAPTADEPSGANPEPTELSPPEEATTPKEATGPESLETRGAAKAKAAETVERPGFTRKLSSFLFGEQEEESTPSRKPRRHLQPSPSPPRRKPK
jgi:hypothetical protein